MEAKASERVFASTDYTIRDQDRMSKASRYFEWQAGMVKAELGQRVVEVGCGLGNFTQHLLDRQLVLSLDVEAECVAHLSGNLQEAENVIPKCLDVLDPAFVELRKHHPDSIVCLNVLEHVRDDRAALSHMARVLPSGGKIVLLVPAFQCLHGPIDERLGHYRRYTKESLREVAAAVGLRPQRMHYMNIVGFFGWWLNAKVLKRKEQSEMQILIFDRFIVPILSRIEGWVKPPFGQLVFAVLVKEAS